VDIIRYVSPVGSMGPAGPQVAVREETGLRPLPVSSLAELLTGSLEQIRQVIEAAGEPTAGTVRLLPPVDGLTEVWASGVTYERSSTARQEESDVADVYARVYTATRPELFFKSPAWRVCGDGYRPGPRAELHPAPGR
jgi:2-dehydro-3-deoxy-D-arabinonate dehydratase